MTKAKALTEEQWLARAEPFRLLRHLQQHGRIGRVLGGRRRLRLYACACFRRAWSLFGASEQRIVEVVERQADGRATGQELEASRQAAASLVRELEAVQPPYRPAAWGPVVPASLVGELEDVQQPSPHASPREPQRLYSRLQLAYALKWALSDSLRRAAAVWGFNVATALAWQAEWERPGCQREVMAAEQRQCADLLRDIFHNPFRPLPVVDSAWLDGKEGTVAKLARAIYDEHRFADLPVLADALEEAGCTDALLIAHCRGGEHARGCWLVDRLLAQE
jgi:hypothetical protein